MTGITKEFQACRGNAKVKETKSLSDLNLSVEAEIALLCTALKISVSQLLDPHMVYDNLLDPSPDSVHSNRFLELRQTREFTALQKKLAVALNYSSKSTPVRQTSQDGFPGSPLFDSSINRK